MPPPPQKITAWKVVPKRLSPWKIDTFKTASHEVFFVIFFLSLIFFIEILSVTKIYFHSISFFVYK